MISKYLVAILLLISSTSTNVVLPPHIKQSTQIEVSASPQDLLTDSLQRKNIHKVKHGRVKKDTLFERTFKKHPLLTAVGFIIGVPLILICGFSTYYMLTFTIHF